MKSFKEVYENWIENADELRDELLRMDAAEVEEAFYRNLEFGTGGLRGIIGAGTNRMNVYTVGRASQGLANYVKKNAQGKTGIAIAYDSRIKSDEFAKVAASVFAANGLEVFLFSELAPTPMLSYAVRYYNCAAGIVITASHNPAQYNGYKVYGPDGCQITTQAAADILAEIERLDYFADVKADSFEKSSLTKYVDDDCYDAYIKSVKEESVLFGDDIDKDVAIVYSPLNGTGLKPVSRVLNEAGYKNVTVVEEQAEPDGNFPTCPYPNPEIREALELGLEYAEKNNADLMLATDPDADRVGIAVRADSGMKLLTGNEVGILLLDYICRQRSGHSKMPEQPLLIKTIVTIDLAERIANNYGVDTINVLTGFKFIGEQIGFLDNENQADRFIFGFEESYGYLAGSYVRDKDAVVAVLLICEMFAYYKTRGISLIEKLNELYGEYGYCENSLNTYEFPGVSGARRMSEIMESFRADLTELGGKAVAKVLDYQRGIDGLPTSDVVKFILEDNCAVVVRPSGTEPKIKIYFSVSAEDKAAAEKIEQEIIKDIEQYM